MSIRQPPAWETSRSKRRYIIFLSFLSGQQWAAGIKHDRTLPVRLAETRSHFSLPGLWWAELPITLNWRLPGQWVTSWQARTAGCTYDFGNLKFQCFSGKIFFIKVFMGLWDKWALHLPMSRHPNIWLYEKLHRLCFFFSKQQYCCAFENTVNLKLFW